MSIKESWGALFSNSENDLTPSMVNSLKEECFIQDLVLECCFILQFYFQSIVPLPEAAVWQYRGFKFPDDLWILIRVAYLTFFYTLLLQRRPFQQVIERFPQSCQTKDREDPNQSIDYILLDKIWRGTSFLLFHILHTDKPCLRRTLVLYHWFCGSDLDLKAFVGVCKEGDIIRSHAWLSIGGAPYRENHEELVKYSPMVEW